MKNEPTIRRAYMRAFSDIANGPLNNSFMDPILDAKYAAARGFVDAVIVPEETRDALELALLVSSNYSGPHLGQFVLPPTLA